MDHPLKYLVYKECEKDGNQDSYYKLDNMHRVIRITQLHIVVESMSPQKV